MEDDDEIRIESGDEGEDNSLTAKDTTEEELERLVFGDEIGFRAGIKSYVQAIHDSISEDEQKKPKGLGEGQPEEAQDLGTLDDAEVCTWPPRLSAHS